jgi:glycosyltransferase involved in cell wall biosynthesis
MVPENAPDLYLAGVREAGVEAPAVVVGDASYAEEFKRELRASAPANAVFTGYQFGAAYQQLTAHAGVFVLAAGVGGTHPVLVEQMAAGNAILARETASNREVLGDAGLFWSTPAELAGLLCKVWPDAAARERLGELARKRARERYSWDEVTSRYLQLCELSLS